jgi:hypothetical protein
MRHIILKISTTILLFLGITGLQAQESIPASGGMAYGYGGTVSYSVGQVVYTVNSEITGSVAQGVQQPYEILSESGSDQATGISLQCSVYPNPVEKVLTLQVQYYIDESVTYSLYDATSQLLKTEMVNNKKTLIIMSYLPPSTYYLVVDQKKQKNSPHVTKTFKIIKK